MVRAEYASRWEGAIGVFVVVVVQYLFRELLDFGCFFYALWGVVGWNSDMSCMHGWMGLGCISVALGGGLLSRTFFAGIMQSPGQILGY